MLVPKLVTTLKSYNKHLFFSDVSSGIIVGIVALPLAIAFGIASGVSPNNGIITAVIAGFIISAMGGSRVQIGGPTGAFIIIVFGIVQKYGMDGLMIATIMAGIILVLMGFMKLGTLIKFIPLPIITGFTSGIALIIFATQIKDLLGLNIKEMPSEFLSKIPVYINNISTLNIETLIVSAISLFIIIGLSKFIKKIPSTFIALIVGTLIVYIFGLNVETISSRFGALSNSLPSPQFPEITYSKVYELAPAAFTIAILAAIESLLSAVVADGMIGGKHRSNMELIANGAANIITPLFGGIPATGAIARTVTNIRNGGKTPVAGITHSLVLLLIMLFFGQYAGMIPLCVLASILVVVAYNMSEWREFKAQLKMPKSDVVVLLTTFFLTVIFDLTIAIEVGMVLSAMLFMKRMAEVTNVGVISREFDEKQEIDDSGVNSIQNKSIPKGVLIYEINGPFFFGAASKFKEAIRIVNKSTKVLIIRLRNVPAIDSTGIATLEDFYYDCKKNNTILVISGIHAQPMFASERAGLLDKIGEENIRGNIDDALNRAREIMGLPVEKIEAELESSVEKKK
ncbi:MAG: STAS domain-containing protein [Ignavibacteria bacterium]|nr:STAS domain-containing protein [Ignavibacteria bacterium]